jgi:small conductance mechanosensitive channel
VLSDPAANVHVESFSGTVVNLQLRAWVATLDYLDTLHALTEAAKIALNRELSGNSEGGAGIAVAPDPGNPSPDTQDGQG